MVKVLHRQSGVCLFTHQWKWDPQAHAEGVDALVLSFTQFAREIDGGDVVQVHFDPSSSSARADKKDRPGSGPLPISVKDMAYSEEATLASSTGGLTMISFQNEAIQAVLFHDRTSDAASVALKMFLQRILQRFAQIFQQELQNLQPQLQQSATPSAAEVLSAFSLDCSMDLAYLADICHCFFAA
ncbi:hypothetical protein BBJ28_00000238 [Nothophytophthora sp. Chile5]|nr:hypothetical protein BBJ28_00000238 [Nothophytophthora sp. Chile5]